MPLVQPVVVFSEIIEMSDAHISVFFLKLNKCFKHVNISLEQNSLSSLKSCEFSVNELERRKIPSPLL